MDAIFRLRLISLLLFVGSVFMFGIGLATDDFWKGIMTGIVFLIAAVMSQRASRRTNQSRGEA